MRRLLTTARALQRRNTATPSMRSRREPLRENVMTVSSNHVTGTTPLRTSGSSRPPALVGVFESLAQQHRQVLELLRGAGSVDGAIKRQARWTEARRRLLAHDRAEAETVYSALAGQDAAHTLLEQHSAQAAELEMAVAELDDTTIESDTWIERLRDVMAMVDDHVRDEENDFFPAAQRLLGESASRELQERFDSAEREALHAL
jgi:hemerythrin superfamily protein